MGNMPHFQHKLLERICPVCRFSCNLCTIFDSFCGEERSKRSNTKKLAMQYAILRKDAIFYFKNTSKVTLMSKKCKKIVNTMFIIQNYEILRSFHRLKIENVQIANKCIIQ